MLGRFYKPQQPKRRAKNIQMKKFMIVIEWLQSHWFLSLVFVLFATSLVERMVWVGTDDRFIGTTTVGRFPGCEGKSVEIKKTDTESVLDYRCSRFADNGIKYWPMIHSGTTPGAK